MGMPQPEDEKLKRLIENDEACRKACREARETVNTTRAAHAAAEVALWKAQRDLDASEAARRAHLSSR
jgi:hypothetical protein